MQVEFVEKWHPTAELFPPMAGEQWEQFVGDVRENGVREPIEVYGGDQYPEYRGFGLDGRNRTRAAKSCCAEPPAVRVLTDADVGPSLVAYILSKNLARRHLDSSQRAIVGAQSLPQLREESAKRQKEAGAAGAEHGVNGGTVAGRGRPRKNAEPSEPEEELEDAKESDECEEEVSETVDRHEGKSTTAAAKLVGVGRATMERADAVIKESDALAKMVSEGKMSVHAAKQLLPLKESDPALFKAIEEGREEPVVGKEMLECKSAYPEVYQRYKRGKATATQTTAEYRERLKQDKKKVEETTTVVLGDAYDKIAREESREVMMALLCGCTEGQVCHMRMLWAEDGFPAWLGEDEKALEKTATKHEIPLAAMEKYQERFAYATSASFGGDGWPEIRREYADRIRHQAKADTEREIEISGRPKDKKTPLRDLKGRAVPTACEAVFTVGVAAFKAALAPLKDILEDMEAIRKEVYGKFVDLSLIEIHANNLKASIQSQMPYVVCPICDEGTGRHVLGTTCKLCNETGWLTKRQFEYCNEAQREIVQHWSECPGGSNCKEVF